MLVDAWNQVADWGIEAIKNIQTQVGLGDEDGSNDECVPTLLPAVECVQTLLPAVAGQPSKPEHKEAAAAASVRVSKGALAALMTERDVLTKAREAFRVQFEKLRDELVVARAAKGKLAISTRRDSLGAEEYENEPVVKKIMQQLHNLNIHKEAQEHRLALLEDQIEHAHDSSYIHIDTFPFTHHTEGSSKHTSPVSTSPVASHRGSGSPVRGSSPVRHTSDTHHTHMERRLSTEGSSSLHASPEASTPQGGGRRFSSSSHHASASPVRGVSHPPLAWGEEPAHRSPIRGNFE